MLGEAYPVLTARSAAVMARLEQSPTGATVLADENIITTRGVATTLLHQLLVRGLIDYASTPRGKVHDHGDRIRVGPRQQFFKLTELGRRALEAHQAALAICAPPTRKRRSNEPEEWWRLRTNGSSR